MASLKLTVGDFSEGFEKGAVDRRAFNILRDYLQPDSDMSLHTASTKILSLVPEHDPKELSISSLGELCIDLVEQIPSSHLSQMKLVRLLQQVAYEPKVATLCIPFRRMGEILRDNLQAPDPENPAVWVNFHSFVAKVESLLWSLRVKPTWAIWAMRDAFEMHDSHYPSNAVRNAYVQAAAQYIVFGGQDLVQNIACPRIVTNEDRQHWKPGSRYSGPANLDLARWRFWRDGFKTAVGSRISSEETKRLARQTFTLMDALQEAMPGLGLGCPL